MNAVAHWIALHAGLIDAIGIDALLGLSVWVVLATGALPLGNVGFAAIAASVTGYVAGAMHWPVALCAATGVLAAMGCGYIVGFAVAGLGRTQLAIVTFAFGIAAAEVIPASHPQSALRFATTPYVYAALLLATFAVWRFMLSKEGRACAAVAQDEGAAAALGIDRKKLRWSSMGAAACIAGLSGVLAAFHAGSAVPALFGFNRTIDGLASAIVGGSTSVAGPITGAIAIGAIPAFFAPVAQHQAVFHAAALLACAIFLPTGLCSLFDRMRRVRILSSRQSA